MNGMEVNMSYGKDDVERDGHDDDSITMDSPFVRIFTPDTNRKWKFSHDFYRI